MTECQSYVRLEVQMHGATCATAELTHPFPLDHAVGQLCCSVEGEDLKTDLRLARTSKTCQS